MVAVLSDLFVILCFHVVWFKNRFTIFCETLVVV